MKRIKAYGKIKLGYIESKENRDFFCSNKENFWDLSPKKIEKCAFDTIACGHHDENIVCDNFNANITPTGIDQKRKDCHQSCDKSISVSSSVKLIHHANQSKNEIGQASVLFKNVSSSSCEHYNFKTSKQKHKHKINFKKHAKDTSSGNQKKNLKVRTNADINKDNYKCPNFRWSSIDNYNFVVEKENLNKDTVKQSKEVKDLFCFNKENIWDLSPKKIEKCAFDINACGHHDENIVCDNFTANITPTGIDQKQKDFHKSCDKSTSVSSSVKLVSHANQSTNKIGTVFKSNSKTSTVFKSVSSPSHEQYKFRISNKHKPRESLKEHAKVTSSENRKKNLKVRNNTKIYKDNLQCPDLTLSSIDRYNFVVEKENFHKEMHLIENNQSCQSLFAASNYDFVSGEKELSKTSGDLLCQNILAENSIDNNTSSDSSRNSKSVSSFDKQSELGDEKIVTSTPITQCVMVGRTNEIKNISSIYRPSSSRQSVVSRTVFKNGKYFSFPKASKNKTVSEFSPLKKKCMDFRDQFMESSLQCYNKEKHCDDMELLNENSNELFQSSTSIEYVNTSDKKQHNIEAESSQIKQLSKTCDCNPPESYSFVSGMSDYHISVSNKMKKVGSFNIPFKQSYLVTKSYSLPAYYEQIAHGSREHSRIVFNKSGLICKKGFANLCFSKSKSLECVFNSDLRFPIDVSIAKEHVCDYSSKSFPSGPTNQFNESVQNSKNCFHSNYKFKAMITENINHKNSKLEQNENASTSKKSEEFHNSRSLVKQVESVAALLQLCGQDEIINFSTVYDWNFCALTKVGEGSYGEVFVLKRRKKTTALKIVPVLIDNETHNSQTFYHMAAEIKIAQCMSSLKDNETNCTQNFCNLERLCIVKGLYPSKLIDAWDKYKTINLTNNLRPTVYDCEQIYVVFETEYGGVDLDKHVLKSAVESVSIYNQIVLSLAVAEEMHHFEHRDLHFGNILVQKTDMKFVKYLWRGEKVYLPSCGLLVKIIDFTLSHLISPSGKVYYHDLVNDVSLFEQTGDYQFDVYRFMKDHLDNEWHKSDLYSNVLWLNYLCVKFLKYPYKHFRGKQHKVSLSKFVDFKNVLMNCNSTTEFLMRSNIL